MEHEVNDPAVDSKKLRDDSKKGNREETESDQCPCRKHLDVSQLSLSKRSDEVGLEHKGAVIDTESLPSSHKLIIRESHPSISAQNSGVAIAPSIRGCNITNYTSIVNQGNVSYDAPSQPKKVEILKCQQQLKITLKRKYSHLLEGFQKPKRAPVDKIYTKLHIITGGNGKVIKEHEVRPMETDTSSDSTEEEPIHCNELFNPPEGEVLRTVMTKGVANIGKTVSTYKFILDWAEEKENTNLAFVFPVPFKDLNLMWKKPYSLEQLLDDLFPDVKGSEIFTLGEHKMLFIFDGLDESKMSLDFNSSEIVSDMTKQSTVADLLINIIRGRLLPSALVWILSRPVASSQIPLDHIDLEIEVQGFNDPQKDEYFRKKIRNPDLAERAITIVKSSRSNHIMCRIPAFCLLCALTLEQKLAKMDGEDMPLTLTPMYIKYLIWDVESMKKKLPGPHSAPNCVSTDIISLGKLAFEELNKDRSIFYESDLTKNNIQITEPSMLSGVYTQIFSEELILCPEKMFSYVHLSVQEFFAALYVYHKFNNDNVNVLIKKSASAESEDMSELNLFKAAVEMSLQCENGHFDIFLRFLLGLSLESNQKSLKSLIANKTNQKTRDEIIEHIKERIRSNPSQDRCHNLCLCLNELGDYSMKMEEKI